MRGKYTHGIGAGDESSWLFCEVSYIIFRQEEEEGGKGNSENFPLSLFVLPRTPGNGVRSAALFIFECVFVARLECLAGDILSQGNHRKFGGRKEEGRV